MNIIKDAKYRSAVAPTASVLIQCFVLSDSGDPEVYVQPDQTACCTTGFPEATQTVRELREHESAEQAKIALFSKRFAWPLSSLYL